MSILKLARPKLQKRVFSSILSENAFSTFSGMNVGSVQRNLSDQYDIAKRFPETLELAEHEIEKKIEEIFSDSNYVVDDLSNESFAYFAALFFVVAEFAVICELQSSLKEADEIVKIMKIDLRKMCAIFVFSKFDYSTSARRNYDYSFDKELYYNNDLFRAEVDSKIESMYVATILLISKFDEKFGFMKLYNEYFSSIVGGYGYMLICDEAIKNLNILSNEKLFEERDYRGYNFSSIYEYFGYVRGLSSAYMKIE